ncbi:AAA family ATPase [Companilactobacillus alimentarius]|uniref:ATP-binding protein n=1 Tax=Companilactobacillus alimentarius TaxID=1602 RepID=UPI0028B64B0E|nr:AAA family ATPase [Companilactobacillus alimentarius]MDT6951171.1 AAA family ATPase [Companilactobacillus alimentarius]
MKLIKAKIYGFGKWVDQEFDFKQDYQVIFGSNEAGKTTLLNFIKSILFGFASARGDNKYLQYKPKNSSSYGGELEFQSDDKSLWLVRRVEGKGNGTVTLFHDDQQVPESLLQEIIGSFTKDDFEHTHVFDDKNILSIYGLDEKQLETEIMSVGAVGSKEWLATADRMNEAAETIYKKRGQKQPLVTKLKERDDLLVEKSEFENQQVAYRKVESQLAQVQEKFDRNEELLKSVSQNENDLRNLDKKWPRYEQLSSSKVPAGSGISVSNDDWENFLTDNQELSTLQETSTTNRVAQLDNVEKQILVNYRTNQKRLDYIRNQKFELQNLQFHRDDMKSKLLKVDTQVDQLFKNNPQLSEDMKPLSSSELGKITPQQNTKNYNLPLIIIGIAVILMFLTKNPLKLIFAIVAIACGVWYWYQGKNSKFKGASGPSFLQQKGYENLTRENILNLQSVVIQLANFRTTQNGLSDGIKAIEVDLNKWRNILIELNVLDKSYKKDNYNEQIEKYFTRLDKIKARADLNAQSASETEKITNDRNQRLQEINAEISRIVAKYQVPNVETFVQMHTNQVQNQRIINEVKQDKAFLGDDLKKLQQYNSHDSLMRDLNQVTKKRQQLTDRNNELSRQMGSLKEQMQQVYDNTQYQKLVDQLAQNQADIVEYYDEWLARKLASKWIRKMLNIATENRYPRMIARATQYFSLLTNNNYIRIDFNKNDIGVISQDKNKFNVHELSQATTIQLYISLRLAFVTEIADLIKLPILIDDAFVDFDISRTNNVFKLIQEVAKSNQVIYVTANEPKHLSQDHILRLGGSNNG